MAEGKPEAYEGDRPYIFADYAHADRDAVLPIIRALVDEGYRVWWDDGIEPTTDYDEYLADHVHGCDCLVMFVSTSSLRSDWCTQEVRYALKLKKKVLPIYLEDVELTRGLQMRMGGKQALFWYEFDSNDAFCKRLFKARRLELCLTDEGRRRRGVKPRGEKPTAEGLAEADVEGVASPEASRKVVGAEDAGHGAAAPGMEELKGSEAMVDEGTKAGAISPGSAEPEAVEPKLDKPKAAEGRAKETPKVARPQAVGPEDVKTKAAEPKPEQPEARRAGASEPVAKNLDAAKDEAAKDDAAKDEAAKDDAAKDEAARRKGVKPKGSLAAYSWVELKALSRAIAAAGSDAEGLAIAKSYRLVDKGGRLWGDEKPLALRDGTKTSVRILGFRHDELVSGGKSGISFEFADVPTTHRMNAGWTNVGGWEKSEMRGWLNSDFLALLPGDVRPLIGVARKRTNNRGKIGFFGGASAVTRTDDKLWLLSSIEVFGVLPGVYGAEGTQYRLYADKGVTTTSYGLCAKSGARSWWWLRSPDAHGSDGFRSVGFGGDWRARYALSDWGVSPGFCL